MAVPASVSPVTERAIMVGPCCYYIGSIALCRGRIVHTLCGPPFLSVDGDGRVGNSPAGNSRGKGYRVPPGLSPDRHPFAGILLRESVEPTAVVVLITRSRLFTARRCDGVS